MNRIKLYMHNNVLITEGFDIVNMPCPMTDAMNHLDEFADIEFCVTDTLNPEIMALNAEREDYDPEATNDLWYAGTAVTRTRNSEY